MKVWPKNDGLRKWLKHPTGVGFRESGPATWPSDAFTTRRIRDGDVTTSEPKSAALKVERKSTQSDAVKSAMKGE